MTQNGNDSAFSGTPETPDVVAGPGYIDTPRHGGMKVDLEGYEGPLDVLLALARVQKVDLKQISILQLAEQYLEFIRQAQNMQIEVAADYLVMASWLAYLKSRLLLPPPEDENEITAEEQAARLLFQLQRLEAMRNAVTQLMERNQLGRDIFARGMPEGIRIKRHSQYDASLFELLANYSSQRLRNYYSEWRPPELPIVSIEKARMRLERLLGKMVDWDRFDALVLAEVKDAKRRRTTAASMLGAVLEFVRDGRMEIQQDKTFGPIMVRRAQLKEVRDIVSAGDNSL